MPAGAIVQKDVVEQFLNEQDSSKRKSHYSGQINRSAALYFPKFEQSSGGDEALLDMGSQIICIDKEESMNGSLNQTQGLARNVLLMIGSIMIYGQLHVIE
uniref:Uncharacterized protein n=1 Tax=Moniliophthora roreri TaxID=221103 RepID=A0A0W0FKG1_MONRR